MSGSLEAINVRIDMQKEQCDRQEVDIDKLANIVHEQSTQIAALAERDKGTGEKVEALESGQQIIFRRLWIIAVSIISGLLTLLIGGLLTFLLGGK